MSTEPPAHALPKAVTTKPRNYLTPTPYRDKRDAARGLAKRRITIRRIAFVSTAVAVCLTAALAFSVTAARRPASPLADLPSGKVQLMSAGALAFGPEGILFVGDSVGGAVVAIDTGDRKAASAAKINIQGIDEKIAALVGVTPDQILINDVKVNPISKNVYLSASRGRGPEAMPLILRVDAAGKITTLPLDNAMHSSVSLVD